MDSETLTVVDMNDVVLGYSTKEDIKRRGLNYRCVQVFMFNEKEELMICKRPDDKKKFPGQFGAVMGHVRRGENYSEAAEREVREELGLNPRLKRVTKFSVVDGANRVFQEIYSGAVSENVTPDKTEISEFRFMTIRDLRADIAMNPQKYAVPFVEALRSFMKASNIY